MAFPYGSNSPYYSQQQPMFPQPNGNVYLIQNSLEVANIPAGAGITLALCANENLLYLKSMQNGVPSFLAYKLTPYENSNPNSSPTPSNSSSLEKRVAALEQKLQQLNGGNNNDVQPATTTDSRSKPTSWDD